ncbi:uncharacterized protein LOC119988404 [Tripterygium wilfordii]|uniref:uncharacterized protein LOC119988404 n=1 Tax=Tripterygium wilfordii TaxID=458696 RepID=UPI0018F83F00|nr:uncharacterized protein LOC119988404 [Tripterygium wilfordii]
MASILGCVPCIHLLFLLRFALPMLGERKQKTLDKRRKNTKHHICKMHKVFLPCLCFASYRHSHPATQPINSMDFFFDEVNFGASNYAHSAYSMVLVAMASIASLFVLSKSNGFVGILFISFNWPSS